MNIYKTITMVAVISIFLGLKFFVSGCDKNSDMPKPVDEGSDILVPVVYTVNYPLYYFATRIAGDNVQVVLPVPADIDPAFWQPDQADLEDFQKADMILLNGAGYAKWVAKSSLPPTRTVNTSVAFSDQYLKNDNTMVHSHGPQGAHEHGMIDFNTWLDPILAIEHAQAVHLALQELFPEKKVELQNNYNALENDLRKLDEALQAVFSGKSSRPFIASHPVYNYLASRYKIDLTSLHWEPDQMPNEDQVLKLTEWFKDHPQAIMLWEGQPCQAIIELMEQLDIPYSVFSPCGNRPEQGDYLAIMFTNISVLKDLLCRNVCHEDK
ncbi:MAG: zinc ABC transporter substrate-binding protein [Phycisphaerae bacterium]|nr:zinc ABC transporter substrate-binding protein [Phycisphaerae bacterium]